MIQLTEFFQPKYETDKLGFDLDRPEFVPQSYLDEKFFVVWRTCHSFGDWVIISAMPRLLKAKYPDCTVAVPSPQLIKLMYPDGVWTNKHEKFENNVAEVFMHNPHVDGMIDELPLHKGIYHDHFRIYDTQNPNVPLVEQMLRYWRFDEKECADSAPELHWSDEERKEGYTALAKLFKGEPFGFLYIDDSFFEVHHPLRETLEYKKQKIQEKINEFPGLRWLYYAGKDIAETPYKTNTETIDIRSLNVTKRVQNYIKSLSWVIIGHQGGYGTDCMSRYPVQGCYVLPNAARFLNEHFIKTTKYILP